MRILGIDPGYDRLGASILDHEAGADTLLYSTCLLSNRRETLPERLATLGGNLEIIMDKWRPELLAIERLFFALNKKTAIAVAETRGMITFLAARHGLAVHEYTPLQIKVSLTGFGRAEKAQVAAMVRQLVRLPQEPRYDDEYDAIAVALTAAADISLKERARG